MAKVTFFVGLCGSGKTYESKQLEQKYFKRKEKVKMFREILGRKETDYPLLIQKLKDGVDCIVEEAFYCVLSHRNEIINRLKREVPEAEIEWFLFENDLEVANENVEIRTNEIMQSQGQGEIERLQKINQNLSRQYDFPEGCTRKPIHPRTQ